MKSSDVYRPGEDEQSRPGLVMAETRELVQAGGLRFQGGTET